MVLESGWGFNLENQNNLYKFSVCKFVTHAISKIVLSQSFSWNNGGIMQLYATCSSIIWWLLWSFGKVTGDLASLQGIFEFDWERCCQGVIGATQEQQKLVDESKLKDLRPRIIVFKRMINQPWSCQRHLRLYAQ